MICLLIGMVFIVVFLFGCYKLNCWYIERNPGEDDWFI